MKAVRKNPRYCVSQFMLKGRLLLLPDPKIIEVQIEDVSGGGVCLGVVSTLTEEQKDKISNLISSSRKGNLVPLQMLFNNMKIPVNAMNCCGVGFFGFAISTHEKLAELAEKGGQFFQMLVDAAVKKGAEEVAEVDYELVEAEMVAATIGIAPTHARQESKAGGLPESLGDLPAKHPTGELIKMRFDAFNKKVIFIRSLGTQLAPFYIDKFVKRDSTMAKMFDENLALQKKTVFRWVGNELNHLAGGSEKTVYALIENYFKQAVYEYMRQKKQTDVTFDEIASINDGRLSQQFTPIRDKFLTAVCELIDAEVQKRFAEYHSDANEEQSKVQVVKEEEQTMQNMAPQDLMIEYIWGKLNELGELAQYQKDAAKSWVGKGKMLSIAKLGGCVVFSRQTLDAFIESAKAKTPNGEKTRDFFDEIDLRKIYVRTIEVKGEKKGGITSVCTLTALPRDLKGTYCWPG
ncbi:MAG: hypothetical protein HY280_01720 [Nitrospinae bacterium]|nr:hypothetical protein [Nitrospinota bacterium]